MRIVPIIVTAAIVASTACSTLRTTADYDRSADFSKYRTFAFKDVQPVHNDLLERRIKTSLEAELASKGLAEEDANPDLLVVTHMRQSRETQITTFDTGWGYGWHWHRGIGTSVSTIETIPVGTLIVDLVDARANELVWRGTAADTLRASATPREKEGTLNEAVAKMFRNFPPAA